MKCQKDIIYYKLLESLLQNFNICLVPNIKLDIFFKKYIQKYGTQYKFQFNNLYQMEQEQSGTDVENKISLDTPDMIESPYDEKEDDDEKEEDDDEKEEEDDDDEKEEEINKIKNELENYIQFIIEYKKYEKISRYSDKILDDIASQSVFYNDSGDRNTLYCIKNYIKGEEISENIRMHNLRGILTNKLKFIFMKFSFELQLGLNMNLSKLAVESTDHILLTNKINEITLRKYKNMAFNEILKDYDNNILFKSSKYDDLIIIVLKNKSIDYTNKDYINFGADNLYPQ